MSYGTGKLTCALLTAGLAWLAVGNYAKACYTGLGLIPTADVVGESKDSVEVQFNGSFLYGNQCTGILNTEFGLTPRVEVGLDYDFSDSPPTRAYLNGKYVLITQDERTPELSVGICSVADKMISSPYVVATKDFNLVRGHAGVMAINGTDRWFVGMDKAITDKVTLMTDYTDGSENSSSIGVNYQFTNNFAMETAAVFPTQGGNTFFNIHFVFCGSLNGQGG
jgi:hypothetical protein